MQPLCFYINKYINRSIDPLIFVSELVQIMKNAPSLSLPHSPSLYLSLPICLSLSLSLFIIFCNLIVFLRLMMSLGSAPLVPPPPDQEVTFSEHTCLLLQYGLHTASVAAMLVGELLWLDSTSTPTPSF